MKKYIFTLSLLIVYTYAPLAFASSGGSSRLVNSLVVPTQCAPYVGFIEKYDWNVQTAINVMFNESTCFQNAVNLKDKHASNLYRDYPDGICWGSFGLFQTSCTDMVYYDPALNIALAYQIYKAQGWLGGWRTTCTTKIKCYN